MWEQLLSLSGGNLSNLFYSILEIFFIYLLIYGTIRMMKGTRAIYILMGIIGSLMVLTIISFLIRFPVIEWIIRQFWAVLAIGCVIIFQPELRRGFAYLGSRRFRSNIPTAQTEAITEICKAAIYMSEHRIGALIVLERAEPIQNEVPAGGVELDAIVSAPLIESIFSTKSPLHDGAVVIQGNKIIAAHMILPLGSSNKEHFGTRHRAAIGISEETDAVALVVSEETGRISLARNGEFHTDIAPYKLNEVLSKTLSIPAPIETESEEI